MFDGNIISGTVKNISLVLQNMPYNLSHNKLANTKKASETQEVPINQMLTALRKNIMFLLMMLVLLCNAQCACACTGRDPPPQLVAQASWSTQCPTWLPCPASLPCPGRPPPPRGCPLPQKWGPGLGRAVCYSVTDAIPDLWWPCGGWSGPAPRCLPPAGWSAQLPGCLAQPRHRRWGLSGGAGRNPGRHLRTVEFSSSTSWGVPTLHGNPLLSDFTSQQLLLTGKPEVSIRAAGSNP